MKNIIKLYILGSIFSIILTMLPFVFIMGHYFSKVMLFFFISFCAILQIIVHLRYFLNLNTAIENRWNFISVLFSTVIIFIIISGTSWIMSNLNSNLMQC
ncbi:cytochrome o ubiquinol oxidase subunit IV [Buchnera aphidicola (Pemphigus obesinymphae)]|uniref:cytochrome o ubiquinol oxidase subunit IV n=1 Tax=Buchnera aphidicola TaxID=9 RepID=UPI0022375D04|nr:cytochrome o ubiquinol oxidase subunit IV [Buchnera aphidicola]MCW5196373.1 cytochrome o ubiquinol oxidase subunit IV [Buchnera aphidicola (Pemphigus obesinymphae)]